MQLEKREANFSMYAWLNTLERVEKYSSSYPHYYSSFNFAIPRGLQYTPLQRILLPFQSIVWFLILGTILITLKVIITIKLYFQYGESFLFGEKNYTPFLNFINIFLGGAILRPPVRNFARSILSIWILGSFILRNSYQGALFTFLQTQKPVHLMDTINKIAGSNYTVYTVPTVYEMMIEGAPNIRKQLRKRRF